MKKTKQILAIIGVVILAGMYLTTLALAIFLPANAMKMFFASVILTVVIPIIIWVYTRLYHLMTKNRKELSEENSKIIDEASISEDKTE